MEPSVLSLAEAETATEKTGIAHKNICCVIHSPPFYQERGENALDFILAASNICEHISVIFLGQGVWQLVHKQKPELLHLKPYAMGFSALTHYDIASVYVQHDALSHYQLSPARLLLTAAYPSNDEIRALLQQQDCVVYF